METGTLALSPALSGAEGVVEGIEKVLDRHQRDKTAIIAILQDIQDEVNYLPEDALRYLAHTLDIPLSKVCSLATFYRAFSLQPRGKHVIHVCLGTACHVRGAVRVLEAVERTLGIRAGGTDENLQFTLETVNCLGACALGPIVVVDGEYHGQMASAKAEALLKRVKARDEADRQH
jgi:NADH-quinone oxidoreductase subunit E